MPKARVISHVREEGRVGCKARGQGEARFGQFFVVFGISKYIFSIFMAKGNQIDYFTIISGQKEIEQMYRPRT